jgi:hemolysin activation/secretion protein
MPASSFWSLGKAPCPDLRASHTSAAISSALIGLAGVVTVVTTLLLSADARCQEVPVAKTPPSAPTNPAAKADKSIEAVPSNDHDFDILEYRVTGNTRLPKIAIEKAVYRFLGPHRSIKDVEQARVALEHAYQKAGYLTVLVYIPEQKVQRGVVKLQVIEGKVGQVKVSGNRYFSAGVIREGASSLAPGIVPNIPTVEKQMIALNKAPDRRVTPALSPGQEPGSVDVELKVADQLPLHGSVDLNNSYTPNTAPLRLNAGLRYDNLWQLQHSIGVSVQVSPQELENSLVYSGSYSLPVGEDALLSFYGLHSNSDVATVGLDVVGAGTILGARGTIPLRPLSSSYSHSVTLGVDYKDLTEMVQFGGATVETPISYTPFLAQYSGMQAGRRGTTQFQVSLNFAPRVAVFGNTDSEFENKRFLAQASYVYVRGDISRTQVLPNGWSVYAMAGGQLADQPLVSSEQYAVGGMATVRGYLDAEVLGDNGLRGRLEVHTPSVTGTGLRLDDFYLLAFLDGAEVRVLDPLPAQTASFHIASGGIGLRMRARGHIDLAADLAYPFIDSTYTRAGDPRIQFSVAYRF